MTAADSDPVDPFAVPKDPEQFYIAPDVVHADVWRLAELAARCLPCVRSMCNEDTATAALSLAVRILYEAEQEIRESRTGHEFFDAEAGGDL